MPRSLCHGLAYNGVACGRRCSWYVANALRGSELQLRRTHLRASGTAALLTVALALIGCGSGQRQDATEKSGKFSVDVTSASLPAKQSLANPVHLEIGVRNAGDVTMPNVVITVTVAGKEGEDSVLPFAQRDPQKGLSMPDRPVWVLEDHFPRVTGATVGAGATTADRKTYQFGQLDPGESIDAIWKLVPVKVGRFALVYQVHAGLTGNAIAVDAAGGKDAVVTDVLPATITGDVPQLEVNANGDVVEIKPQPKSGGSGEKGSK